MEDKIEINREEFEMIKGSLSYEDFDLEIRIFEKPGGWNTYYFKRS